MPQLLYPKPSPHHEFADVICSKPVHRIARFYPDRKSTGSKEQTTFGGTQKCRRRALSIMGQALAKKDVGKGMKLYNEQRFEEAVTEWMKALGKVSKCSVTFDILGYLCMAFYDVGKYRHVLEYADRQIEIANIVNDPVMKSVAYFNLARGNERLSEFTKATSYCRQSLQNETKDPTVHGYVYLCIANAFCGESEFVKACKNLDESLANSRNYGDKVLEMLTYAGYGQLFTQLQDFETGLSYHIKAAEIAQGFDVNSETWSKYQRRTGVGLAVPYWKLGRYTEAMEHCEDAMKTALMYADRPVQGRCLQCFADIHRKRNDYERALPRYESAYAIMVEIGDRLGQVEVLGGIAKTVASVGNAGKAIELTQKALELAQTIGSKLELLRCHIRLEDLHSSLEQYDSARRHILIRKQLLDEMDLFCGVCSELMGEKPEKLEALPCGHIIHSKCMPHLARSTWGRRSTKRRPCPSCRQKSAENPTMFT